MDGAHVRTLQRALEIVATRERLASGTKPLPPRAFLDALDIVAAKPR
jgi:hypothetical protein